jgi:hypothetical protein
MGPLVHPTIRDSVSIGSENSWDAPDNGDDWMGDFGGAMILGFEDKKLSPA